MKNKKTLVWIIVAVAIALCAVGVYFAATTGILGGNELGTDTITFDISVTVGGEEIVWSEEVEITEGTSLIDAMTANMTDNGGVVYSDTEYGAYITSICGYSENAATSEYWVYTINGESAMVGASDYYPVEGDDVVFDLSPLVW